MRVQLPSRRAMVISRGIASLLCSLVIVPSGFCACPQTSTPGVSVTARTLTKVNCYAKAESEARVKEVPADKAFARSVKVASSESNARADVTAGHWTRETPTRATTMVYVSSAVSLRLSKKANAIVHTAADTTNPVKHGFEFKLTAPVKTTGTLTLTISGRSTQGATDQFDIVVKGDGWSKKLASSSDKRFAKTVLPNVSIDPTGLIIEIHGLAVASLTDKGQCSAMGRASARFDVIRQ
ncbi:MAG: hypothetical protein R3F30_02465 [Planctomycetota bacterium]